MADPVITDHYRVLAVFQRSSGLPEDVCVNSWAFRNDQLGAGIEGVGGAMKNALDAFYYGDDGAGNAPADFFSVGLVGLEYRVYDLGQPVPRQPYIVSSDLFVTTSQRGFPGEVAAVMSFVAGVNAPRNRGRVYLGPLNRNAAATTGGREVVNPAFRDAVVNNAEALAGTSESVTWTLISQADAAAKVITGGWMDDGFDTIRSRGRAAESRATWGSETP